MDQDKSEIKKIGILGGSFDPAHKGHVKISIEAKKRYKLQEIIEKKPKKIHRLIYESIVNLLSFYRVHAKL